MRYKHKRNGQIISASVYVSLSAHEKLEYEIYEEGDVYKSSAVDMLGYSLLTGDADTWFSNNDSSSSDTEFGGGDFGGAGAGDTW